MRTALLALFVLVGQDPKVEKPAPAPAPAPAVAQAAPDGKKAAQRCAGCHAIPDLSLRADRLWVEMIGEST